MVEVEVLWDMTVMGSAGSDLLAAVEGSKKSGIEIFKKWPRSGTFGATVLEPGGTYKFQSWPNHLLIVWYQCGRADFDQISICGIDHF